MDAMHGAEKARITSSVVRRLIAAQFPEWSHLEVTPVEHDGWDNTSFRLGDEMSVRLPSADGYVAQVEKEHRWLPDLGPHLPQSIPTPVAKGVASDEFGRPWSVYSWLPGRAANVGGITDLVQFGADLAYFLTALQCIDSTDGPGAGSHSHFRGGPLTTYDAETRHCIRLLASIIDEDAVLEVWESALATVWNRDPVWVHGDMAASNLLVVDGRLSAVIDFGCSSVGDPACDLVIAWTLFSGDSRRAFADGVSLDEGTWARARGWAMWKALITYRDAIAADSVGAAEHRFGWRVNAAELIQDLCSEISSMPTTWSPTPG